jgi:hypothetical protein
VSSTGNIRFRSMGFLAYNQETWACFLGTFQERQGTWRGFFSFRPGEDAPKYRAEVRTADIFMEASEGEIDRKARGLGRPILTGLLASALHTQARSHQEAPALRAWFQEMLRQADPPEATADPGDTDRTLSDLRRRYEAYRMDQMVHLISLIDPADFQNAVQEILEGKTFDFSARDRLQFAMMVVDHLERLLPLPSFETWAASYLNNPQAYQAYGHALYREGVVDDVVLSSPDEEPARS